MFVTAGVARQVLQSRCCKAGVAKQVMQGRCCEIGVLRAGGRILIPI